MLYYMAVPEKKSNDKWITFMIYWFVGTDFSIFPGVLRVCVCAYIYTSIMHLYTYITYTYRMLREVVFSTDIRTWSKDLDGIGWKRGRLCDTPSNWAWALNCQAVLGSPSARCWTPGEGDGERYTIIINNNNNNDMTLYICI